MNNIWHPLGDAWSFTSQRERLLYEFCVRQKTQPRHWGALWCGCTSCENWVRSEVGADASAFSRNEIDRVEDRLRRKHPEIR